MDRKRIHVLLILVFYQTMSLAAVEYTEGMQVHIKCDPKEKGSMTVWFRILDNSRIEFIASFSNNVRKETVASPSSNFSFGKIQDNTITLQSFRENHDSGLYSCASLYKGKELSFGQVTRLAAQKAKEVEAPKAAPTELEPPMTPAPCSCPTSPDYQGEASPPLFCTPLFYGPLLGACSLLLVLLIATILYCNKMRTRRCPHHYKRRPQK